MDNLRSLLDIGRIDKIENTTNTELHVVEKGVDDGLDENFLQ